MRPNVARIPRRRQSSARREAGGAARGSPVPFGMPAYRTAPDHETTGWPKGIPYILGNDGCERFSYYGMKAILFVFLTRLLVGEGASSQIAEKEATEILHLFNAAVYALPLLGGVIADRLLGKYPTILYL